MSILNEVYEKVKQRDPNQPEFLQAVSALKPIDLFHFPQQSLTFRDVLRLTGRTLLLSMT